MVSQRQIKDLHVDTIANASTKGRIDEILFVQETHKIYGYEIDAGLVADGKDILVANGVNGFWVAVTTPTVENTFASLTDVSAVEPKKPIIDEIEAFALGIEFKDGTLFYTGTDSDLDTITHVYTIDGEGYAVVSKEPISGNMASLLEAQGTLRTGLSIIRNVDLTIGLTLGSLFSMNTLTGFIDTNIVSASSPTTFRYMDNAGNEVTGDITAIDATTYYQGATEFTVPDDNDATFQKVFVNSNGDVRIVKGSNAYGTLIIASSRYSEESIVPISGYTYIGGFLVRKDVVTMSSTRYRPVYASKWGESAIGSDSASEAFFGEPVADLTALSALTTPLDGETRQVLGNTDTEIVHYVFNTTTTTGVPSNDGTTGGWKLLREPTVLMTVHNGVSPVTMIGDIHNESEVHIETNGNDVSIDATMWEDGQRFTIINTAGTPTTTRLLPSNFIASFLRDGTSTEISAGLNIALEVDQAFLCRVTDNGGNKFLNLYPIGAGFDFDLRKPPVVDATALAQLTAEEYEQRRLDSTGFTYDFVPTAKLTATEDASLNSVPDNAGTGKWVRSLNMTVNEINENIEFQPTYTIKYLTPDIAEVSFMIDSTSDTIQTRNYPVLFDEIPRDENIFLSICARDNASHSINYMAGSATLTGFQIDRHGDIDGVVEVAVKILGKISNLKSNNYVLPEAITTADLITCTFNGGDSLDMFEGAGVYQHKIALPVNEELASINNGGTIVDARLGIVAVKRNIGDGGVDFTVTTQTSNDVHTFSPTLQGASAAQIATTNVVGWTKCKIIVRLYNVKTAYTFDREDLTLNSGFHVVYGAISTDQDDIGVAQMTFTSISDSGATVECDGIGYNADAGVYSDRDSNSAYYIESIKFIK